MATEPHTKHCLVLEEDRGIREHIGAILEEAGWASALAAGLDEALELVVRRSPDLVISDIDVQPLVELQLARQRLHAVAVRPFALLAMGIRRRVDIIEALGAFDFVCHPFESRHLRELIARAPSVQNYAREFVRSPAKEVERMAVIRDVMDRKRESDRHRRMPH